MSIIYEPLTMLDYESALSLWKSIGGMGLSDADDGQPIARFLSRNPHTCIKAVDSSAGLIGTVLVGHDGRRGYLYHMAVAESFRRQGVGQTLMRHALQALQTEGIRKCHLMVFDENELGKAFWMATGWTRRHDIALFSLQL